MLFATFKVDFESNRKYITVYVNTIPLCFQFDITLISRSTWEQIGKPVLQKTNHIARSAPGKRDSTHQCIKLHSYFLWKTLFWCMLHYGLWSKFNWLRLGGWAQISILFLIHFLFALFSTPRNTSHALKTNFSGAFQEKLGRWTIFNATLKSKPND